MTDTRTPDSLRPGDQVGSWHIEGYAGRGTYGVVYQARRAGRPESVPVALKLAFFPYDPRFLREVGLLSRVHHPAVPELLDWGWWITAEGRGHPYLVMQWVNGLPLYEWARVRNPTCRQVLQVLAQVAWALEVLHTTEGVHRDVKGGNILVEPDGRAFLMDFGSGTWTGAPPLTESLMPPGTREYRGPEALRFQWHHLRERGAHYEAQTFDDLYALGVSFYRLVTGMYPPPGTDPEARLDPIRVPPPPREPPQQLNARVVPELSALIERMLAANPKERGLAREVALAAEAAAAHAGPGADVPLFGPASSATGAIMRAEPQVDATESLGGCLIIALVPLAVVVVLCMGRGLRTESPSITQANEPGAEVSRDGGTAGLGETSLTSRVTSIDVPSSTESIALEVPDEPLPGQQHAPCRRLGQVEINGGCWGLAKMDPPCADKTYEWKGACYWPVPMRSRAPTSKKPQ